MSQMWYAEGEKQPSDSAVINLAPDLGDIDRDELSQQPGTSSASSRSEESGGAGGSEGGQFYGDVKAQLGQSAADLVWQAGKQQAQKAFSLYGNIDVLRPYFDVEPNVVLKRLAMSFIPQKFSGGPQKVVSELYGPLMVILTLVLILILGMKEADHQVREGTLMGTAMGLCFSYWIISSALFYCTAYVCSTHISPTQILSLNGYAMFGYCIVLFLGTMFHDAQSHFIFYLLFFVFGLLPAVRMVTILASRTRNRSQQLILAVVVLALHLLFLLYLHFAYHKITDSTGKLLPPVNAKEFVRKVADQLMVKYKESAAAGTTHKLPDQPSIVKEAVESIRKGPQIQ